MRISSTYNTASALLTFSICLWLLSGCAASGKTSLRSTTPDSTALRQKIIDPWSLGPDVFALASHSDIIEVDTNQVEQEVTSEIAEPEVVVQATEPSRKFAEPAQPSANLPVTTQALDTLSSAESRPDTIFTVQLGTFLDKARAQEFYDRASSVLGMTGVIQGDWPFYRLRFGDFSTRTSADSLHRVAMSRGFYDARVMKIRASE